MELILLILLFNEIYYYRLFLFTPKPLAKSLIVSFNPAQQDNSGFYEFFLKSSTEELLLGNVTFVADRTNPLRVSKEPSYAVTNHQSKYYCAQIGQKTNRDVVLWYIMFHDKVQLITADRNFIYHNQVGGFVKLYCYITRICETSDIMYPNGTTEALTWATDFRPTTTPTPTTVKPTSVIVTRGRCYTIVIDQTNTKPTTSGITVKSASLLTIILLLLN